MPEQQEVNPLKELNRSKRVVNKVYTYQHEPNEFLNLKVFKKARPAGVRGYRQVFFDVSMANHHGGLPEIAEKAGIDIESLKPGDFLLFINSGGTYAKLLGPMNMIVSVKSDRGKLVAKVLEKIPEILFGGQPFDYDSTLGPILEAHLSERAKARREALRVRAMEHEEV